MNHISDEDFLKQPKETQETLRSWWQPQMYDLFFRDFRSDKDTYLNGVYKSCIQDNETLKNATKNNTFLPLLVEGQLRQFIEDKTGYTITPKFEEYNSPFINDTYYIHLFDSKKTHKIIQTYEIETSSLLKAYWQVACQIAQKEVNNQKQNIISTNRQGLPVIKGGGKTMREMYNEKCR